MPDPIGPERLNPAGAPATRPTGPRVEGGDRAAFAAQLREQLEQVSQMQADAAEGIESLMTGQTDNITGVFTTARKAEVAFSLLMEIRNKLVDAYDELRQLRV